LHGNERIKSSFEPTLYAHHNQMPLDLMCLIIESSSDLVDVVLKLFGGLFNVSLSVALSNCTSYAAEIKYIICKE
jgi:DNA modification methylase